MAIAGRDRWHSSMCVSKVHRPGSRVAAHSRARQSGLGWEVHVASLGVPGYAYARSASLAFFCAGVATFRGPAMQ